MLRILVNNRRVNSAQGTNSAAISRRSRFLAAFLGIGLLAMLSLASQLRPDPRGRGTHEQLGLPKCSFLALTGKRCPACGMTTSWAYATHGQIPSALATHAAGTLLAPICVIVAATALTIAVRGRLLDWSPNENTILGLVAIATALIGCEWIVRLWIE